MKLELIDQLPNVLAGLVRSHRLPLGPPLQCIQETLLQAATFAFQALQQHQPKTADPKVVHAYLQAIGLSPLPTDTASIHRAYRLYPSFLNCRGTLQAVRILVEIIAGEKPRLRWKSQASRLTRLPIKLSAKHKRLLAGSRTTEVICIFLPNSLDTTTIELLTCHLRRHLPPTIQFQLCMRNESPCTFVPIRLLADCSDSQQLDRPFDNMARCGQRLISEMHSTNPASLLQSEPLLAPKLKSRSKRERNKACQQPH